MTDLVALFNGSWGWTGERFTRIGAISSFGHMVIEDEAGHYWYFDPDTLRLDKVSEDEAGLNAYMARPDTRDIWLALTLRDEAEEMLGALSEGAAYSWKIPPTLGGNFDVENMCILPLSELVNLTGSLAEQIKDLPDGQKIELKVVE